MQKCRLLQVPVCSDVVSTSHGGAGADWTLQAGSGCCCMCWATRACLDDTQQQKVRRLHRNQRDRAPVGLPQGGTQHAGSVSRTAQQAPFQPRRALPPEVQTDQIAQHRHAEAETAAVVGSHHQHRRTGR